MPQGRVERAECRNSWEGRTDLWSMGVKKKVVWLESRMVKLKIN